MGKFKGEFKKFIARGNVIDLAVGVIIGGAFTTIVNAVTNGIINPIIAWLLNLLANGQSMEEIYTFLYKAVKITGEVDLANSIYIDWSSLITSVINFFLTALVLFFIVKVINNAKEITQIYGGFTKAEYKQMRKQGLNLKEIKELSNKKTAELEAQKQAEAEEAKKHTVEGLLEQIKNLLEENQNLKNENKVNKE